MKKKEIHKIAANKHNLWLAAYLDEGTETFFNASKSAAKAGYRASTAISLANTGHRLWLRMRPKIAKWLDEEGYSDEKLKGKLLRLVDAKDTVFQRLKGAVKAEDLPPGYKLVTLTGVVHEIEGGNVFSDGDSLIEVTVEAIETQRRSIDMALKIKGAYAAEKREHTGKDGGPIQIETKNPMNRKALLNAIKRDQEEE